MGDESSTGCAFDCFLLFIHDEWLADDYASLIAPTNSNKRRVRTNSEGHSYICKLSLLDNFLL